LLCFALVTKHGDFILFKERANKKKNKEHLTIEGFNKIISIRASMNKGLPEVLKLAFPNIIGFTTPLVTLPEKLNPYWVAGAYFVSTQMLKVFFFC
jgi:hypothetical protein